MSPKSGEAPPEMKLSPPKLPRKHVDNNLNGIEVMTMITQISSGFIVIAANQIMILNNMNMNNKDDDDHDDDA